MALLLALTGLAALAGLAAGCRGGEVPPDLKVAEVFGRAPVCSTDATVAAPAPPPAGSPTLVVLISVDGLRPDAIFRAPAAQLQELACRGAYSWQALTILPSFTLPSHASMLSGVLAEQHLIYRNDSDPSYVPITVPTVLSLAKAAGKRVVVVVGKEKMGQLAPEGSRDVFRWIDAGDDAVVDAALAELPGGFDLLFVHLPGADLMGHAAGWMTTRYLAKVRDIDRAIGRLLAALPPHATVIVTADHGGASYVHGTAVAEHATIPWIVQGPGIAAGRALTGEIRAIRTIDTAATIAHVLQLEFPEPVLGRPVLEALSLPPP